MDLLSAAAFRVIIAASAVAIAVCCLFAIIVLNDIKIAEQQQNVSLQQQNVSLQQIKDATDSQTLSLKNGIYDIRNELWRMN